jgi:iron complex outermembrane recepter protein
MEGCRDAARIGQRRSVTCESNAARTRLTQALTLGALCLSSHAVGALSPAESLKKLSIEQLLDVEVTTVSRTSERLGEAAAAVAVVTNEDIRRSGATSIAEALRGVPGLHVARRTSNSWAISARGFSSVNSEKLLVLNDSRSVYTPLYSGVFWDVQDYLLQDIERIEVIRGPGAALWGSNAVNGVINIISRHSRDTQGLYVETGAGNEDEVMAGARFGGTIGERGSFRVFGKYTDRDGTYHPGAQSDDDWDLGQIGFRGDFEASDRDSVMLQGAAYDGDIGQVSPSIALLTRPGPVGTLRAGVSGGHVLARWQRTLDEHTHWAARAYYDHTRRDDPSFRDELDTVDLDLQHGFALAGHNLIWGLNYRHTDNRNERGIIFNLDPASSQDDVISAFVQDQIQLTESLKATIGTKLEDNEFSDFEVQPSVRLAWDIVPGQTLWGAVSRAARIPTRLERDFAIDVTDPNGNPIVRILGNEDFDSEELLAYEAGYRWQALAHLSLDVAAFYNRYEGLASLELGDPFIDPVDGRTVVPILNQNLTDGDSQGLEILLTYSPLRQWRVSTSYSFVELDLDPRGTDLNRGRAYEGATPRHQIGLRSSLDVTDSLQLDAFLRYSSDIEESPDNSSDEGIDGYTELDVRVAWQAWEQLEVSVVGQNLLDERHVEFGSPEARGAIERSVYAKLAWGF